MKKRDFSHNFNLPKIKGIEVTGYKKPTPEDRKKWTGSFQMMCPIHIIDDEKFRIFNDIAMRNFELHNKINFEKFKNNPISDMLKFVLYKKANFKKNNLDAIFCIMVIKKIIKNIN